MKSNNPRHTDVYAYPLQVIMAAFMLLFGVLFSVTGLQSIDNALIGMIFALYGGSKLTKLIDPSKARLINAIDLCVFAMITVNLIRFAFHFFGG